MATEATEAAAPVEPATQSLLGTALGDAAKAESGAAAAADKALAEANKHHTKARPAAPVAKTSTAAPEAKAAGAEQKKDGQPVEGKITKEGEPAKAGETPPSEIAITLPEGVEANAVLLDKFKPLAKELGLSSENAQKLVDLHVEALSTVGAKEREHQNQERAEWIKQAKADKELQLDSKETQGAMSMALKRFGLRDAQGFAELLDRTGVGNHPLFLDFVKRVGLSLREDRIAGTTGSSGAAANGGTSREEFLRTRYPNSPQLFKANP